MKQSVVHWEVIAPIEALKAVAEGRSPTYVPAGACGPMDNPVLTRIIEDVTCGSCKRTASFKWNLEHRPGI